ncbi:hypothetical protein C7212DRAFT_357535 [Tuber magnatum]|uniref:PHD-type domain-containing protein n=1 Tax=Tuber magnatum TaxID=42249 RepID=A0A317SR47_9PEZI|nr:hypothetical protein C7212DRAFT_357535 [Tuber magnatum]
MSQQSEESPFRDQPSRLLNRPAHQTTKLAARPKTQHPYPTLSEILALAHRFAVPTPRRMTESNTQTPMDSTIDTDMVLRQNLEHWQQMAPPPPPQGMQTPMGISVASGTLEAQLAESQSPELLTPRTAQTPKGGARARAKGGTGRGTRRRKASNAPIKDESDGASSEEFTMEGVKTKSGRKVHRPAHFNPAQKQPSRRRGPYRRIHDARICKICQRGHSPQSNMIVFCDGCNTPYHQLCHDPPIDDLVIAVAEAEWFCASCSKKREERPLATGLSGQSLTEDEKRAYLASLPLSSLVELIFFCEKAHPDIPLYDPKTRSIVANIKTTSATAVGKDGDDETPGVNGDSAPGEAEGGEPPTLTGVPNWEDMIDSNYPALEDRDIRSEAQGSLQSALRKSRLLREGHSYKVNPEYVSNKSCAPSQTDNIPIIPPGSGIKLPPETEDTDGLLVDDDLVAFSHRFNETAISHRIGVSVDDDDVMGGIGDGDDGGILGIDNINGVQDTDDGNEDAPGEPDAEAVPAPVAMG